MPVVNFENIEVTLPDVSVEELSTDQRYLYEICSGISKGIILLSLSKKDPGKMSHARWLTMANRILRLYVSTEFPSTNLKVLTKYVIRVYAFAWFNIKTKYFAHPENILLAMLADGWKHMRELGLHRILKCRQMKAKENIREFKIPTLNFEADDVPDKIRILKYPCHSQAVEQNVKLVTKTSAAVCGNKAQGRFIRSGITSRHALPKFDTKREYFKVL
ncbi:hypothetical protein RN001_004455 [Aquatica leii]|uniref:Uncharacterized protein n=1 Tax=Aquatica leii TaxID=1421715 RepID=A0AAN7PIE0_9COLE|nr:hypothetical protein RN001_004455 [Aquatica leii]